MTTLDVERRVGESSRVSIGRSVTRLFSAHPQKSWVHVYLWYTGARMAKPRIQARVESPEKDEFDEWLEESDIESKTAAVRHLWRLGLDHELGRRPATDGGEVMDKLEEIEHKTSQQRELLTEQQQQQRRLWKMNRLTALLNVVALAFVALAVSGVLDGTTTAVGGVGLMVGLLAWVAYTRLAAGGVE